MNQFVKAYLWDEPMGIISRDTKTQEVRFEFLPSFIQSGLEPSPIIFPMERLRQKSEVFLYEATGNGLKNIPPIFRDSLPGEYAKRLLGFALRDSSKTPESLSALSYLSLLGNRGMGALGFEPSGYPELNQAEAFDIEQIVRYAHLLYNNETSLSERRIRVLLRSGLFTGGSWPKAVVAINDFTGEVLSGQSVVPEGYDGWILKLNGVGETDPDALHEEYVYCRKASECGITMVPYRFIKDRHHTHLLCKRFDRMGKDKVHIQSFAALRDQQEDSYEAAFRCMRQLHLPYPDIEQLFKRLVFNVLIGNCKDSPDKVLFTYTHDRVWHLAPAFGLKPTTNLTKHAMSVNGKGCDIGTEDLLQLGKMLNIKQAKAILKTCKEVLNNHN